MPSKLISYAGGTGIICLCLLLFFLHAVQHEIKDAASTLLPFQYHIVAAQNVTLITEPDDGIEPILSQIQSASSTIDMVMYELEDQQVEQALAAAAGRGVTVRVMLNGGLYGKGSAANKQAFTYLQSHGVSVKSSPAYFALTHQKTLIIDAGSDTKTSLLVDSSRAVIMTFNLVSKDYAKTRDFGIIDPDPHDVSAIERSFSSDWNSTQTTANNGDDLVWSPNAKQLLLAMINSAHHSLLVTSEELEDADSIAALAAAAERGVQVEILMTNNKKWQLAFETLSKDGVQVRVYAPDASLYIHEKISIVDGRQAFIGSQNLTATSLLKNRELGIFVSTPSVVTELEKVFAHDWSNAS